MTKFIKKLRLVENPKAMRSSPFIAKVNLEESKLEFLNRISGDKYRGEYELENGQFYITREDWSSHKNARVSYTLYYAKNNELEIVASIFFGNAGYREFSGSEYISEDEVKKIYLKQTENKVVNTLIEVAKIVADTVPYDPYDDLVSSILREVREKGLELSELLKRLKKEVKKNGLERR